MNVVGKGNVKLLLNGVNHVVHEVYYVPKLKNNLLSIGQLQERGLMILIKGGAYSSPYKCSARKMSSYKPSRFLFHLASMIWPLELQRFENLAMVHGLPQFQASNTTCTNCINGKQHRDDIPKRSTWIAIQPLELIHANICGHISPKSNNGKRYTLCFIDDYSRKSWVYLLIAKCEALNCFKVFKKMVEKEKGLFVKCLGTDGGVKNVTPQEAWSRVKPSVEHFRVFGCLAHVHIPNVRRGRKVVGFGVNFEVQILLDLEWGENEENNEGEERVSENEDEDGNGDRGERSDSEGNEEAWGREVGNPYGPNENEGRVNEGRVRHPPPYLYYYVSGESLGEDEINFIEKNKTWTLTELPARAKKIGVKWVYKTKYNEHEEINKHKARLKAKGYSQKHDIDYTEVFAPVARMDTGLEKKGKKHLVYKLHKSLYGLKQAPRAWFSRIEAYFINEGFQRCDIEQTLFTKRNREGQIIIVSIYVDDLIFTGDDEDMMSEFKSYMLREFDMSDLGSMRFFLGIEILQRAYGFMISKDEDGITVDETYFKQLVGSLTYLTTTRPNMMFVTSLISRYIAKPIELHLQAAKRALRYLKEIVNYGIHYKRGRDGKLLAFTDSNYAGDMKDRKSTSGYVFLLSSGVVSWSSKKQPIVTLSTTEAEFVAAVVCACQANWMKKGIEGARACKHIDVRYHLLRNLTKKGSIALVHCGSDDQVADVMTKPLKVDAFQKLRSLLGVCEIADVN
ncbi:unnamed protein product [Prunus armeniaca]